MGGHSSFSCPTIILTVISAIGFIIMICVGSTVVREYNLAKHFKPTQCKLLGVQELGFRTCEYCYTTHTSTRRHGVKHRTTKQKCRPSSFPCVRMSVGYSDRYGQKYNATYYPDVLFSTRSILCSFYHCGRYPYDNERQVMTEVNAFQHTHTHPFKCFYDINQPLKVIGRKIHTYSDALHGMLWPGLLAGGCMIAAIATCFGLCRNTKSKGEDNTSLIKEDKKSEKDKYGGLSNDGNSDRNTPGGIPPHVPSPITGPQPVPTQPYHPPGPPAYPPADPKTFPDPRQQDPAYPPPGPSQYPPAAPGHYPGYPGYPPAGPQPGVYPPPAPAPGPGPVNPPMNDPSGQQPYPAVPYPPPSHNYYAAPPGADKTTSKPAQKAALPPFRGTR